MSALRTKQRKLTHKGFLSSKFEHGSLELRAKTCGLNFASVRCSVRSLPSSAPAQGEAGWACLGFVGFWLLSPNPAERNEKAVCCGTVFIPLSPPLPPSLLGLGTHVWGVPARHGQACLGIWATPLAQELILFFGRTPTASLRLGLAG